jgi:N-acetylmuramate 1-kinase
MDQRYQELCRWVAQALDLPSVELSPVSGDASFRRYFRYTQGVQTFIAMDAPPEKEDSSSFVAIARSWREQGIEVPELLEVDLEKGFLLLSDFGDEVLLDQLNATQPDISQGERYYTSAMQTLQAIQGLKPASDYPLPAYDSALLQREMALFPDWLLDKKLALDLTDSERDLLTSVFSVLENSALAQKQVSVHRDYHARNLMVLDQGLGVIDFQDAVQGPQTYDLVSLLRDCYIVWPDEQVDKWCRDFYVMSAESPKDLSYEQFKQDFDWMGMQRHLKAAGIFARLSLRDGKHAYLNDIPRTVEYLYRVSSVYPQFSDFSEFLRSRVMPALNERLGAA